MTSSLSSNVEFQCIYLTRIEPLRYTVHLQEGPGKKTRQEITYYKINSKKETNHTKQLTENEKQKCKNKNKGKQTIPNVHDPRDSLCFQDLCGQI